MILRTDLLRHTELFSAILDDDLAYIATRTTRFALEKGKRLFTSGDAAVRFYLLERGSVRIFRSMDGGVEDEMAIFASGDTIGDFDFARSARYDAHAEACEPSILIAFPPLGSTIADIERERPDIAARLRVRFLTMLSGRLRSTQKLISENAPWVQELRRRAYEDGGTGLWTRAFLDEVVFPGLRENVAFIAFKPDRFKELVDSRGHAAGDEAMVRIAAVMQHLVRSASRGWALRLRSNECALVVPQCAESEAEALAAKLEKAILALDPAPPQGASPAFHFSATIVWALWPEDGALHSELFARTYDAMMERWRSGSGGHSRIAAPVASGDAT